MSYLPTASISYIVYLEGLHNLNANLILLIQVSVNATSASPRGKTLTGCLSHDAIDTLFLICLLNNHYLASFNVYAYNININFR